MGGGCRRCCHRCCQLGPGRQVASRTAGPPGRRTGSGAAELRITRVFPCVARGLKARICFRFRAAGNHRLLMAVFRATWNNAVFNEWRAWRLERCKLQMAARSTYQRLLGKRPDPMSSGEKRPEQPESPRAFVCPWCEMPALAIVRGTAIWDGWNKERTFPVTLPVEYALVQCSECREGSVQIREDFGRGFQDDKPGIVYPAKRKLSRDVPAPLRREFEEAQACFSAKAYEATVVMVRRILEGACKENDVQGRNLVKAWKNSKPMGLLIIRLRTGRTPFAFSEMRVRTTLGGEFHATIQRMRLRSLRHSSTISMYFANVLTSSREDVRTKELPSEAARRDSNPNLLIRGSRHIVQDIPLPSLCWADIPQLSVQDRCCLAAWQQYWQQSRRVCFVPRPPAVQAQLQSI